MPQLQLAFGFLFKLDDESIERHVNERAVKTIDEELESGVKKEFTQEESSVVENVFFDSIFFHCIHFYSSLFYFKIIVKIHEYIRKEKSSPYSP